MSARDEPSGKGPISVNEAEISQYITETFEGVDVVAASDASFFFYNPDNDVPPDHRFPFVTLVTSDDFDQFSDLNRPEVFRLNIGISKQTFRSRFGMFKPPSGQENADEGEEIAGTYDFTALDQV